MMEKVGIIGLGTIGLKLVEYFAEKGFSVTGVTRKDIKGKVATFKTNVDKKIKYDKIPMQAVESLLARANISDDLSAITECDMVLESVVEDFSAKVDVLSRIAAATNGKKTIIGSTTSSLSLDSLREAARLHSLVGLHFFNPPTKMKLVEIAFSGSGGDEERARVLSLLGKLDDKIIIEMPAVQGYVVNRILFTQINYAIRFMDENDFDPSIIDRTMRAGTNAPMGPIELSDYIGNDVSLQILQAFWLSTGDPVYKPAERLIRIVDEGKLGKKSGAGFYSYR